MSLSQFTQQLSNCKLTRIDLDLEHYYYGNDEYYVSLTHILDIGAPFPEGLRQYLRRSSEEESLELLTMTKDRGSKLHHALESLTAGSELYLEDYPSTYEKDAIVTFIRTLRFLFPDGKLPKESRTELIVADPKRKVGGTLDFVTIADKRRLEALLKPLGAIKLVNDEFVLAKPLVGRTHPVKFVMDYKFTGRSSYNHKPVNTDLCITKAMPKKSQPLRLLSGAIARGISYIMICSTPVCRPRALTGFMTQLWNILVNFLNRLSW